MRSKLAAYVVLPAALLLGAGWTLGRFEQGQAEARAAQVSVPVPEGDCCLWRLQKNGRGEIDQGLGEPYKCKSGETARGDFRLRVPKLLSGGPPCDELARLVPDGSRLEAEGHVIRRTDDLAHFLGKFRVAGPSGAVLFSGYLEAMHRVDPFHKPFGADPCDRRDHLQGWLVGAGEGDAKGFTLRALLTARTEPRDGGARGYALGAVSLDGVLVECHR